jgi:alginate O-acetyltransferase complex protein AlgI
MLFNSIQFLFFFIIVTTLYFILPYRYRWFLLLVSSCYFYMAFVPVYILILGFTIVVDYFAGILIENRQGKKRKKFLIASLFANIGVLAVFKYYNFLDHNLTAILGSFRMENPIPYLHIILPIGLSFHTFQAMSYTIEVYRGHQKAERNFGIYALYVMFYPQLVAGPIERPQNLIHQFYEKHDFDYRRAIEGLKLMLWGLFKKIIIADTCATYVNDIFSNYQNLPGSVLMLGVFYFAFQVYGDFSGYSDMAIGAARVMGFRLMRNFAYPFFSRDVAELWRRWHISLSSWFRDYLYYPIGGSRGSKFFVIRNILIIFTVSGFWHGANWNYVIWGFLNGVWFIPLYLLGINRQNIDVVANNRILPNIKEVLQMTYTFLLFCLALAFFRSASLPDSLKYLGIIFSGSVFTIPGSQYLGVIPLLILFNMIEWVSRKKEHPLEISTLPVFVRWSTYLLAGFVIILAFDKNPNAFIYFQF